MKRQQGFTLIELVIVVLLIGILASVAVPRFLDITGNAHSANVNGTAGAIASAVNISHAKWVASGQPTVVAPIAGLDLTGSSNQDTGFNVAGWPVAATDGSANVVAASVLGGGGNDNQICAQVITNLLSTSSVTFGAGASCGSDFCAEYAAPNCVYTYQQDTTVARSITYNTNTGAITRVAP